MSVASGRRLWAGRSAALIGIILLALNLRTAVTAISPIVALVAADIPLGGVGLGLLGSLPPILFAVSGLVAPPVAKRLGLEATIVFACTAMVIGPLVRAFAGSYALLVIGSVVAFAGTGFANILLPPLIKKYFPDRIAQLTSVYATIISVSIAVPALLATPLATAFGWRIAVASWSILALAALVPWMLVWAQARRAARLEGATVISQARADLLGRMFRSRIAWAIAIAFSVTALNTYAFLAWLPEVLHGLTGMASAEAGGLLSLFGVVGAPVALIAPLLAVRVRNVGIVILAGMGCFVAGYLGLLVTPSAATGLWVVLVGVGTIIFPLCLALIGLRAATPETAVALSGFVQAVGYTAGALGPLLFGFLFDLTGGWTAPLMLLLGVSLVAIVPAIILARPKLVDEELAEQDARAAS